MSLEHEMQKLQKKPYETRLKILWVAVLASAVILVVLWIFNLKNTFKNIDTDSLIKTDPRVASLETDIPLLTVERVEKTTGNFKIYFNLHNQTNDILNVPDLSQIKLDINGQTFNPKQITNRQGQKFIQKVLSGTQAFGILVFNQIEGEEATLTFDQMFFEKTPGEIFKQELKLELNKLNTDGKLRN